MKLKQISLELPYLVTYNPFPHRRADVKKNFESFRKKEYREVSDRMNKGVLKSLGRKSTILGCLALSTGCAHINVNQLAYEVLRQEDCRINQLEEFCTRNFAKEYHEYELLRRDFMRSQQQADWRASLDEPSITTVSIQ